MPKARKADGLTVTLLTVKVATKHVVDHLAKSVKDTQPVGLRPELVKSAVEVSRGVKSRLKEKRMRI